LGIENAFSMFVIAGLSWRVLTESCDETASAARAAAVHSARARCVGAASGGRPRMETP